MLNLIIALKIRASQWFQLGNVVNQTKIFEMIWKFEKIIVFASADFQTSVFSDLFYSAPRNTHLNF